MVLPAPNLYLVENKHLICSSFSPHYLFMFLVITVSMWACVSVHWYVLLFIIFSSCLFLAIMVLYCLGLQIQLVPFICLEHPILPYLPPTWIFNLQMQFKKFKFTRPLSCLHGLLIRLDLRSISKVSSLHLLLMFLPLSPFTTWGTLTLIKSSILATTDPYPEA